MTNTNGQAEKTKLTSEDILSAAQKFRQMNIVQEIEDIGQSYLLLSIFERIKNIVDSHNKKMEKKPWYFLKNAILNQAINEIDKEIYKIKPRHFQKAIREMLFFRDLEFDKYIYDKNHIVRLFVTPGSIISFSAIVTSFVSDPTRNFHLSLITIIILITLSWIVGHALINYFSRIDKWNLSWKYLLKLVSFSSFGVFLSLYSLINSRDNTTLNVFILVLVFIGMSAFSLIKVNGFGSFDIKILNVFEELRANLKQINQKVVDSTIESVNTILNFSTKYNTIIAESKITEKIYIESLHIVNSILDIECEKRAQYTDNEGKTVEDIIDKKKEVEDLLSKKSADIYVGSKKLPDLLSEIVKDMKTSVKTMNLDDAKSQFVDGAITQLSSIAESFNMDGSEAIDRYGLVQMKETLIKLSKFIMSQPPSQQNINLGSGPFNPNIGSQTNTYNVQSINLLDLASELSTLRQEMIKQATATDAEHSIAIGNIACAEQAASLNNQSKTFEHLKSVGQWTLDIASKIAVPIAVKAIQQSIGQ
jgi:hypothetical protein